MAAENEIEVELKKLPANVKTAFVDALADIEHDDFEIEADRYEDEGQTVYEIGFEIGETEIEVEIASDGTVLEVEVETNDDDDDDDDDDYQSPTN